MTANDSALDRFLPVRTQSADEMCDALSRVYAKPTLHPKSRTKRGDVKFNCCQMKDIGLGYAQYGIGGEVSYANQHNYSHLLETQSPDSALSQIQQAEAYIDATVHRAITLEEFGGSHGGKRAESI